MQELCVYMIYVKTGLDPISGTDSKISVTFYDKDRNAVCIQDLGTYNEIMGPDWNYFEQDNTDIFSVKGPCLNGPICKMNLTSDGSGAHHRWYCSSVEVTSARLQKPCSQTTFRVEQWLGKDSTPSKLIAFREKC